MDYRHLTGSTHYSPEDDAWFVRSRDLVSHECDTQEGLEQAFRVAVDECIVDCKALK